MIEAVPPPCGNCTAGVAAFVTEISVAGTCGGGGGVWFTVTVASSSSETGWSSSSTPVAVTTSVSVCVTVAVKVHVYDATGRIWREPAGPAAMPSSRVQVPFPFTLP